MNLRRRPFTFIVLGGAVALCAGLVGARAAGLPILATSTAAHSVAAEHLTGGLPAVDDTANGGTEASESPEATETPEATDTPEATETPDATETPEASEDAQDEDDQQAPAPSHSDSPDSQEHDGSSGGTGENVSSPSGGTR